MPPPAMATSQRRDLLRAHAAAIRRSISSGSVGMPAVRTSGLPSVTTTSSSMRTPMPHHSRRTSLLPGGDVDAGLDGGDHARLQQPPLVADLVLADVVHVHAEPMPDAVHEEPAVGAVLDQFRHAALQQAEAHEALRDGAHRRLVRLVPVRPGPDLRDRRLLRLQHHLVDGPLPAAVAAADGKRARDVGGVVVELAARVDQEQLAVLHLAAVLAVVQHAGIGPAADDRVVGDVGAAAVELVQDLRHHLVFHAARPRRRGGAPVRGAGDLRRAAHGDQLGAALGEAHLVQRMVERHELVRRVHAVPALGAKLVDPADHALVELRVRAHGVEHARAALDQARQDLVDVADREGVVGAVVADRALGTRPRAVPGLARRVAVAHEQHELPLRPAGNQHGDGLRLGEGGQVVEVAVGAVVVLDVVVAHAHRGSRQDRDRVAPHVPHQQAAPPRELILAHRPLPPRARRR